GDQELGDDEDLEIEDSGRQWTNDKCPLSMKEVLDLQRPVKDPLGYVYEHSAVMEYLRHHPHGHKHPVAGVTQLLRACDLVPATEVERAKKRRRLQQNLMGSAANNNNNNQQQEEEIIDV
ncbi:hypothetical protein Agub_g10543, partial [Astrephomene gubernaculifera]